jgi:error-prone DNA polymerase
MTGGVSKFKEKLIAGMVDRDYTIEFANKLFSQIEGFGSYGFPESHAASFALIAYASSWMKCHHPDVFCCALLNAQPMGFYAPAQIVRDARAHEVEVRSVSVNESMWDCTLEGKAVRLGLRMAKGLATAHADEMIKHRGSGYHSIEDMWRRLHVPVSALERLAEADAFQTLGLDRRQALWTIRGLSDTRLPLFDTVPAEPDPEPAVALAAMTTGRQVVEDYRSVGLTLRRHPVSFLRHDLAERRIVRCVDLATIRDGTRLEVAGIILVRQRPGSAGGVLFVTIEDETGHANLILWSSVFEAQRPLILSASMIACRGKLQRAGEVMHVVAEHLTDLSDLLRDVGQRDEAFRVPHGRGDDSYLECAPDSRETKIIRGRDIHVRQKGIKVPTRDFR